MGQRELRGVGHKAAVIEQIEIDGARAIGLVGGGPAESVLDALEMVEQIQ